MDHAVSSAPLRTRERPIGRWVAILVLGAVTGALLWRGFRFYPLGLTARAAHPDYHRLSPSGFLGHGYGIVGTALIATNLLYLVRRRFARLIPRWAGSMRAWLNAHAFTGLLGSLLVLFHSAFQLRTPIATVTSASLLIVVVTGLVGFYLHVLIPKPGGKKFRERVAELRPLLPDFTGAVDELLAHAQVTSLPHDASLLRALVTVPRWIGEARARRRAVRDAARGDKLFRVVLRSDPALARSFVNELARLLAKEVDTEVSAAMLRSWRSLHRFLAILMLASVSVHIGVAWFYGFRWVFER